MDSLKLGNDIFVIFLGNLATIATLIVYIIKLQKWVDIHNIEHELLIQDYMDRKQIKHLPTRPRK